MIGDLNRMTIKRGLGRGRLFWGLLCLFVGVVSFFDFLPTAVVFGSAAVVLLLGRTWVTIDRTSGTVSVRRGLLVPLWGRERPLDDVKTVGLWKETRGGKNYSYTAYPVALEGPDEPVEIEAPRKYDRARRRAEAVARFLDLGLEDASSGRTVFREPATLNESLRDRLRRTGRRPAMPEAPSGARSKVAVFGDEATFEIPLPWWETRLPLLIGLGILAAAAIGAIAMRIDAGAEPAAEADGGPSVAAIIICAVAGAAFALPFIFMGLRSATSRQFLTVSPRTLRLERRSPLGSTVKEIPTDELEELTVGSAVVARSDRATVEFGRALERGELGWLKDVIEFVVTA